VWVNWNHTLDAWWQPTDEETIDLIFSLAYIRPGETVYDLGCGDGRFLIRAARRYEAVGVGIEIDPVRVIISRIRLIFSGVYSRVTIKFSNMYEASIDDADVIFLFLSETANAKLADKLGNETRPGTRVISYYHEIPNWKPIKTKHNDMGYPVYLYKSGGSK